MSGKSGVNPAQFRYRIRGVQMQNATGDECCWEGADA